MKNIFLLLLPFLLFSCQEKNKDTETTTEVLDPIATNELDIQAELASIEESRTAFQLAIKENRFGDLSNYVTKDFLLHTPNCGDWAPYAALQQNPAGAFNYDSLVMRPRETVIVNDSMAYDFGTSATFYTNEAGTPIEITATYLALLKKDKRDSIWKLYKEVANTRVLE